MPKLIAPPGIDSSQNVFEQLRRLFQLRNELVHHKTKAGSDFSAPPDFPSDMLPRDCVSLIIDLLKALQKVDPKDEFGKFVLKHISSWVKYVGQNLDFYPILWEA